MQKLIFTLVLAVASLMGLHAQEFQGMAVYESKTSTADFKSRMEGNKNMTPDMQKMIEERMKKMFEKVKMTFDRKTYRMQVVVLTEPGGDYTEIEFLNAEFNKKLDATLFDLK